MKKYFIFFDNDGVTAHFATWGNDTILKDSMDGIGVIDIYKWNFLDKICRRLKDDTEVYAVCISSWKRTFYDKRATNKLARRAGLKKIKFFYDKKCLTLPRFSYHEPYDRLSDIKNYLKKYKPDDFVIFDDEFVSDYINQGYEKNLISTEMYNGLTFQNANQFSNIVDNWDVKEKYIKYKQERDKLEKILLGSIC